MSVELPRGAFHGPGGILSKHDKKSKMRIVVTRTEEVQQDPFYFMGVRELARVTGYDASNLSKYKNGVLPCPMRVYLKLWEAVDAKYETLTATQESKESK